MKTPYKNIYDSLKINRFVVIASIVGAVITSVVSVFLSFKMHKKMLSSAFAIHQDGSVLPLKLVNSKDHLEIEAKAHLELFHQYFYDLDASNFEANIEKALWLADASVDAVYQQKKLEGVYNRLMQYALVQDVLEVSSTIRLTKEPYEFETRLLFQVKRAEIVDQYRLITKGKLIHVDRNFPKNTHGLLITEFYESSLQKVVISKTAKDESRKE